VTRRTEYLSDDLHAYVAAHSMAPGPVLTELADETARLYPADMGLQIGPEQGAFMTLLARSIGARDALEIGTFTGYSSICIASGLAPGGRLLCCDVSEEWTSVARRYWRRAGVADRVELRLGPALETLRALPREPAYDLVFIDAEKTEYPAYWEEAVPRVRPGGVLLVDNTLSHGRVVTGDDSARVQVVRAFNDQVVGDDRVEAVLLPVGDGLTFARRVG
jgi:caffeoyl-CoA O-methyltransferase